MNTQILNYFSVVLAGAIQVMVWYQQGICASPLQRSLIWDPLEFLALHLHLSRCYLIIRTFLCGMFLLGNMKECEIPSSHIQQKWNKTCYVNMKFFLLFLFKPASCLPLLLSVCEDRTLQQLLSSFAHSSWNTLLHSFICYRTLFLCLVLLKRNTLQHFLFQKGEFSPWSCVILPILSFYSHISAFLCHVPLNKHY